jgi:superfamily I DNA and/or RNA helicase
VSTVEIKIIHSILEGLVNSGFDIRKGKGLGIISPFRAQVNALKTSIGKLINNKNVNIFSNMIRDGDLDCEVSTVDGFQGRDMDAVILSTVKNVDNGTYICIYIYIYI